MLLKDFISVIENAFPYLFEKYGFRIVKSEQYVKGYYEGCVVGLESDACRIAFVHEEPGYPGAVIGTLEDDFGNFAEWVNLSDLLFYLRKEPLRWEHPYKRGLRYDEYVAEALSLLSERLEPLCEDVLRMFVDKDSKTRWKARCDQYRRKEIERQFGLRET